MKLLNGTTDVNDKHKLARLSIILSIVAWLTILTFLLLTMSEGGAAAFACLIMIVVFSTGFVFDILGTLSFAKIRPGCLSPLYFAVWYIAVYIWCGSLIRSLFEPIYETPAKNILFSLAFVVPTLFAIWKIAIGYSLRGRRRHTPFLREI